MFNKMLMFTLYKFLSHSKNSIIEGRKGRKTESVLILGLNQENYVFVWGLCTCAWICMYKHIFLIWIYCGYIFIYLRIISGILFVYLAGGSHNQ